MLDQSIIVHSATTNSVHKESLVMLDPVRRNGVEQMELEHIEI